MPLSESITNEDWKALMDVLASAVKKLDEKQVEPVKLAILEYAGTAAMLGLQDLADTARRCEDFLLHTVAPQWELEATATLSFSMGALLEKMQLQTYGPEFSSGLGEITLYLDLYSAEDGESDISSDGPMSSSPIEAMSGIEPPGSRLDGPPPPTPAPVEANLSTPATPDGEVMRPDRDMGFVMDKVDWYQQVLGNDPTSPAFIPLAEELCFRGQWRKAAEVCRKGLLRHPYLTRGRVLMGWALSEQGRTDEAEGFLHEAREDLEANGILYRILGEIAEKRGDSRQAAEYRDLFVRLVPVDGAPAGKRLSPSGMEEELRGKEPLLIDFLSALQQRFQDRKSGEELPLGPLFGREDRLALRQVLSEATL